MAIIGYARTSTEDQKAGLEEQKRQLLAAGVEEKWLYVEEVSSVAERRELEAAIHHARKRDVFVVCKIDRLARSVKDLCEIVERLKTEGVALRILDLGIDTSTACGDLVLKLLGSIAEFERKCMLERQTIGIKAAKAAGKYRGRPSIPATKKEQILALAREGVKTREQIAKELGVNIRTVFRTLRASEAIMGA